MPARGAKHPAVQPLTDLDRTQAKQPRCLGLNVIGLDVEVVARRVVDRLHRQDEAGERPRQRGELLLVRHGNGRHSQRC